MKKENFPFLSLQQNFPLIANSTFKSNNSDRNIKTLYFLDKKIKFPLNKKLELKQNKEETKSDDQENFQIEKNNSPNRKNQEQPFSDAEKNFIVWKKKQLIKMNEEFKNVILNNNIFLQQKLKKNVIANRNENKFFLSSLSQKIIKEGDDLICENDSKLPYPYFTNLDSIMKREKIKFHGNY